MKTGSSESQADTEELNQSQVGERALRLVHPSASATESDNLVFTERKWRSRKRNRKKMETFWFFWLRFRRAYDSAYDSDSVASENQPLAIVEISLLSGVKIAVRKDLSDFKSKA